MFCFFGLNQHICFVEEYFDLPSKEADSGPNQISKMDLSVKISISFRP